MNGLCEKPFPILTFFSTPLTLVTLIMQFFTVILSLFLKAVLFVLSHLGYYTLCQCVLAIFNEMKFQFIKKNGILVVVQCVRHLPCMRTMKV